MMGMKDKNEDKVNVNMEDGNIERRNDNRAVMQGEENVNNNTSSSPPGSSRVLLLLNLTRSVTEGDVEGLVRPFTKGQKPKIYLQASAGRAFVEFTDEESAKNALNYFRMHPVQLKGSSVNVTLSKRESVSTIHENANNTNEPYKILLASVTNLHYYVDIDVIHFLFSKYGTVEKIVTFSRNSSMFQALIQFRDPCDAKHALMDLHNRNIYDGCNTLQIQPSHLTDLVVKSNSSRSYDYTVGSSAHGVNGGGGPGGHDGSFAKYNGGMGPGVLPTPSTMPNNYSYGQSAPGGSYMSGGMMGGRGGGGGGGMYNSSSSAAGGGMGGNNLMAIYDKLPREIKEMNLENCNKNQTPVVICYHLPPDGVNVQKLFNLFSLYGTVVRIKILRDKPDTALIQYSDPLYASLAYNFLQNACVCGSEIQVSFSKNHEVKLPASSQMMNSSSAASASSMGGGGHRLSSANNYQDGGGRGNDSDGRNAHMMNEDPDLKTKTFQVKEQRYGLGDDIEKYVKGASRPTATLFVANVDENATEEEIKKIFSAYGNVNKILFKPPRENAKTQMVVVAMNDELEALNALMNLHNTSLHNRSIKVAFSKTVLN